MGLNDSVRHGNNREATQTYMFQTKIRGAPGLRARAIRACENRTDQVEIQKGYQSWRIQGHIRMSSVSMIDGERRDIQRQEVKGSIYIYVYVYDDGAYSGVLVVWVSLDIKTKQNPQRKGDQVISCFDHEQAELND